MSAAISHANTVLSWLENLPSEDTPPRWMWHLDHELEPWFQRVKAKRDGSTAREVDAMTENQDPNVVALRARTRR